MKVFVVHFSTLQTKIFNDLQDFEKVLTVAFSALTLFVGYQEEHPGRKN